MQHIELYEYSSDTYAIVCAKYIEQFNHLGGQYHDQLIINDIKTPGWLFPKSTLSSVKQYLNSNKTLVASDIVQVPSELSIHTSSIGSRVPPANTIIIQRSEYDNLLSRVVESENKCCVNYRQRTNKSDRNYKTDMYDIGEVD